MSLRKWYGHLEYLTQMKSLIEQPVDLVNHLIALFPDFAAEWDEGKAFGYENGSYSFHAIMLMFGPMSATCLNQADDKTIRAFAELLSQAIENGGQIENAVSTCFLEHASELGVVGILKPHLDVKTRAVLR